MSPLYEPFKTALFRTTTKTQLLVFVRFDSFVIVSLMGNWEFNQSKTPGCLIAFASEANASLSMDTPRLRFRLPKLDQ